MSKVNNTPRDEQIQLGTPLVGTFFPDVKASTMREQAFDWPELVAFIKSSPTYTHKSALPLVSFCRFSGQPNDTGCLRHADAVQEVTALEIDYDRGEISVDQARERLQDAGLASVIYSTPRCHETDDRGVQLGWRWRAILPLTSPVPPDMRARLIGHLNYIFESKLARESFTLSQTFYVGRVHGVHWEVAETEGQTLDALDMVTDLPVAMPEYLGKHDQAVQDPRDKDNAVGAFCRAYSATEAMQTFLPEVFTHVRGRRWTWIGHVAEGIWVHDLGQHVGGSHDSWPAGTNQLMNTFDLVRHFKFGAQDTEADLSLPPFKRPSFKAMLTFMDGLEPVREQGWRMGDYSNAPSPLDFEIVDREVERLETASDPGYQLMSFDQMRNRPEPRWLVNGIIPEKSVCMIFGASGSGKSFWALDLMLSICQGTGYGYMGARRVEQANVLYIAAEGQGGVGKRVEAYGVEHLVKPGDIPPERFSVLPAAPDLSVAEDVARVKRAVQTQMPDGVGFICIDTLSAVSPTLDENQKEILRLTDVAQRLVHELECTVCLVHHTGKDQGRGARGFSGLKAAMDAEIMIVRDEDEKTGQRSWCAELTKCKDGEDGLRFGFELVPRVLGVNQYNEERTSLVVRHLATPPDKKKKGKDVTLNETETLLVDALEALGVDQSHPASSVYDKAQQADPDKSISTLRQAMKRLVKKKIPGATIEAEINNRLTTYRLLSGDLTDQFEAVEEVENEPENDAAEGADDDE